MVTSEELSALMEPFDTFWEAPEDIEQGYNRFYQFYKRNYLPHLPQERDIETLVVSCGPGYFLNLMSQKNYNNVLGIDSDPEKLAYARGRDLNCIEARAFEFLEETDKEFDLIICEQELNHLTKKEMLAFLNLCQRRLRTGGTLVVHVLNGANPVTGAEALAQNFDHFNTFTEYSLRQVLTYAGFDEIEVFPLNLYVFYRNPFNYVALILAQLLSFFFRATFILYGKHNRLFTKKIAASCIKPSR